MKSRQAAVLLLTSSLLCCRVAAADTAAVTTVDSLAGLAHHAGLSHMRVKMKPGTYVLHDAALSGSASVKHPAKPGQATGEYRVNYLLHFAGDDSIYDLTDVVITIDTKLHQAVRGPFDKIFVSGNRTTITGLTVNDRGDTPPGKGGLRMMHVIGNGNTIENVTLRPRGSAPYGYGNLLGKGSHALVELHKQSCLLITGRDNRIVGAKVIARVFGHGIVMQGAVNTLIQDCYVEGELRRTDEMLRETSGPAFEVDFKSDYPPGRIEPGRIVSLNEDGVRAYPSGSQVGGRRTDKITVINTTVKNMRSGFDLEAASGAVVISGCTSLGCDQQGFSVPSGGTITASKGDARYGPLLALRQKKDHGCRVELELMESTSEFPPRRLAEINGTGHVITLRNHAGNRSTGTIPIVFGETFWADAHHFRDPTTTMESLTGARGVELRNYTGQPIVFSTTARDCVVTTGGEILRDDGTNNRVETLAAAARDPVAPRARP